MLCLFFSIADSRLCIQKLGAQSWRYYFSCPCAEVELMVIICVCFRSIGYLLRKVKKTCASTLQKEKTNLLDRKIMLHMLGTPFFASRLSKQKRYSSNSKRFEKTNNKYNLCECDTRYAFVEFAEFSFEKVGNTKTEEEKWAYFQYLSVIETVMKWSLVIDVESKIRKEKKCRSWKWKFKWGVKILGA